MGTLDKQYVLETLLRSHEAYFDVTKDYEYAGRRFAGYAELCSYNKQSALVERAKPWEVDALEYIFFDVADHLDDAWANEAYRYMTNEAINKVTADENHVSSCVSLIVVVDSADEKTLAKIKKMHFRKNYSLGFRGWTDLRMAVIDLSSMEVITNGVGKEMTPVLRACLRNLQRSSEKAQT